MGELVRLAVDIVQFIWPFRIVHQWEMGGYYFCGRFWKVVGPGVYPVVPWFMDVKAASVVADMVSTARQDVTLKDKTLVSFTGAAKIRITDYNLAMNNIHDHETAGVEILAAVLADRIASVDAERVQPDKRARLLADLTRWYQAEVTQYGITVEAVYFTDFVLNPRTFRLIQQH